MQAPLTAGPAQDIYDTILSIALSFVTCLDPVRTYDQSVRQSPPQNRRRAQQQPAPESTAGGRIQCSNVASACVLGIINLALRLFGYW